MARSAQWERTQRVRPWLGHAWVLALTLIVGIPIVHTATHPLGGGDVYWQLRAGDDIVRTLTLPTVDTFSYTIPGAPWNNHEWGYEILLSLLVRFLGVGALRGMVLVLAGGSVAGVAVAVGRRASILAGGVAAALFLLLGTYKFIPAPQTLSMAVFFMAWRFALRDQVFASPARAAVLLAGLVLWANLTAEVLLFIPFLVVDQVLRVVRDPRGWRRTLTGVALALGTPWITPPSSSVIAYALAGSRVNRVVNGEFTHLWESPQTVSMGAHTVAWVVTMLYVSWSVVRIRSALARPHAPRWEILRPCALGLLAMAAAVTFERNLWLLVIPAAQMLVAVTAWCRVHHRETAGDLSLGALIFLLLTVWAHGQHWSPGLAARQLSDRAYWSTPIAPAQVPVGAGRFLAALPWGSRVFTDRTWASWVIWRAPGVRVFIDGRNLEYPPDVHRAATEIWYGGPHALALLDATRTRWVLATPAWGVLPGIRTGPWRPVVGTHVWTLYQPRPR